MPLNILKFLVVECNMIMSHTIESGYLLHSYQLPLILVHWFSITCEVRDICDKPRQADEPWKRAKQLSMSSYGVNEQELIRVYHAIITSLMFASPAYSQLPATLLAKLEKFQRPSVDLRWFVLRLWLLPLEAAAVSILCQAEENAEHPLHVFVPSGLLPVTHKLRVLVSNTSSRLNSFVSASLLANCQ